MPDARCTGGLVCMCTEKCAHEHTGQRRQSDIPRAMALRLIRDLPGDRLSCHRRPKKLASRELDASVEASEPHDFAVRIRAIRQRRIRVHRSLSHVRDDGRRPSSRDRMAIDMPLICPTTEAEYF